MAIPNDTAVGAGKDDAHSHAFGQVVDGHCQGQHRSAGQVGTEAFGLAAPEMQVRSQLINQQQEPDAKEESYGSGHHCPCAP